MRHIQAVGYVAVALMASIGLVSAAITEGQRQRIRDSAAVLDEIHNAPDKGIPENLWEKAACVVVIPAVKKGAFVVGGEYGKGVMSCRAGSGWSALSSVMLAKGSVGFQIGGEAVDLVLLVMNERGVKKLLEDKVTLGGEASVAGGPVGRDARALTDLQLKAEMLSWSRSQGVFAGVDLSGGTLKPDKDDNRKLYGRPVSARDILVDKRVTPTPEEAPFMAALGRNVPAESPHRQ